MPVKRELQEREPDRTEVLKRTTLLLDAVQSMTQVGGWELDLERNALFWTDETYRLHDTTPEEYTPEVATAIQFYAPECIPVIKVAVQNSIAKGIPYDLELELITLKGRRIWVHTTSQITVEKGRMVKITGAFQDITNRKNLEEQYRQSQKMEAVGKLAGGIAHDFNNLLTVINGYSALLLPILRDFSEAREMVEQIGIAGERAAALTQQILAYSRKQILQPSLLELNELITSTRKMLARLIGEQIELVTIPALSSCFVKADRSQIEQVIVNLVVNARDAMPSGGKIVIESSPIEIEAAQAEICPGSYILLAVSDTGLGMDKETLEQIFDPFFTTKEPGKGTGLGLATVYGIVKQSGGHIRVYSELHHGTSFKIFLPRIRDEAEMQGTPLEVVRNPRGSETVLLAEDEDAVRALARCILQAAGYIVLEAANGAEALEIVARHIGPIDLLLTDVVMPEMGGRELAESLQIFHPEIGLLFMSGYTEDAVVRHGVFQADMAFLQKPFNVRTLSKIVRDVLDRRKAAIEERNRTPNETQSPNPERP